VQDDILQSLMYEFGPKQPQPSSLDALLAIGLATATSSFDSSEMPVNRVPGGTISFIFEKFSTTIEKENVGEPEDDNSS
jgi:hypothetical protein